MVLALIAVAALAGRSGGADAAIGPERWWAGPVVGDLPLTDEDEVSVFYGTCAASGDSGCDPPVEIQTTTGCVSNPVALDVGPRSVGRLAGGALVARYDEGTTRVATGVRSIAVFAFERAVTDAAIRQLRPRSAVDSPAVLPAPRWPRPVLSELRRVVDQRRRTPAIRDVARRTGVSRVAVKLRLRIAELLPVGALDDVHAPRLSWAEIDRRRQAVVRAREGFDGVDRRTLARWARSVRGLTGTC